MPTLTVFANFYIHTEERWIRVRDSFRSFKDIGVDRWVINVRGKYREELLAFLSAEVGDRLAPYRLQSKKGWFRDSREMLAEVRTDFVFLWLEDHLNLAPKELYPKILAEMAEQKSEYLVYSWFANGAFASRYRGIPKIASANLETFSLDREAHAIMQRNSPGGFIICMQGIFSRALFEKLIRTNHPVLPRWPKHLPFDFEKRGKDVSWLPLQMSLSKAELFASIDDDHGQPHSCLQSRGLYPKRSTRALNPEGEAAVIVESENRFLLFLKRALPESWIYFLRRIRFVWRAL